MKTKLISTIIVIAIAGFLFINQMQKADAPASEPSGKTTVEASVYHLAYWAEEIVGEDATVNLVTDIGSDPHSFSLSPSQRIRLQEADIFLFNGADLDIWAEEVHEDLEEAGVRTIEAASLLNLEEEHHNEDEDEHEDEDHEDDGHEHGSLDPHFWLDLQHAQTLVTGIQEALAQADPAHAGNYLIRAQDLKQRLQDLDDQFKSGLASCELNDIVVAHDAYGYMSKRYGFNTLAIAGISPNAKPSAKTYGELQTSAIDKGIEVIFFETFVDPKITDAFANDIGASTLVLHPLGGLSEEQTKAGETYFTLMQENLQNLETALKCS